MWPDVTPAMGVTQSQVSTLRLGIASRPSQAWHLVTFTKNGITFSICGHFCAVKPWHHVTSIPWDVYTATTLNLTLTLISKTLKTGLNITCTSSNKIVFSDGSDLEFGEFYLAFLGITSLALVEDVVFFSKPKEKKSHNRTDPKIMHTCAQPCYKLLFSQKWHNF